MKELKWEVGGVEGKIEVEVGGGRGEMREKEDEGEEVKGEGKWEVEEMIKKFKVGRERVDVDVRLGEDGEELGVVEVEVEGFGGEGCGDERGGRGKGGGGWVGESVRGGGGRCLREGWGGYWG